MYFNFKLVNKRFCFQLKKNGEKHMKFQLFNSLAAKCNSYKGSVVPKKRNKKKCTVNAYLVFADIAIL